MDRLRQQIWLNIVKTLIVAFTTILFLASCGEDNDTLTVRTVTIDEFQDYSIIERNIETLHNSNSKTTKITIYHVFSNDKDNLVFNTIAISDLFKLKSAEPTLFANVKRGEILWQRKNHDVTEYEDKASRVRAVFAFNEEGDLDLLTIGPEVNDLPTGEMTYNGTNLLAVRDDSKNVHVGEFSLSVNFGNGTGEITHARSMLNGTTDQFSDLTGNFAVNAETGNFSGNELDLIIHPLDALNREVLEASIYGSFHGNDAVGISGLYHNNAGSPEYVGAIVGARTDMR